VTRHGTVASARTAHGSRLHVIAYAGMFVFGAVIALVGALLPVLSSRLALDLDRAGLVFLVTNAAMLVVSLVVGPLSDRVGLKAPLVVGALLVAAALAGIVHAADLESLLVAGALLGAGGGALNAGTNTLVADLDEDPGHKAAALNLLGGFYGFGALVLPLSVGALLPRAGIAGLLGTGVVLCVVTALGTGAVRFPPPKQHGWPLADVGRIARAPLVVVLAVLLFFESGNEFVLGGYVSSFLTREMDFTVESASYRLAAYWAAIMTARVLLSRVTARLGAPRVVTSGAAVAAAAALVVALSPSATVVSTSIVVTGLALAGIFPAVLGIAGAAFPSHSGTVFGLLFTAALTGGMTLPPLAGQIAVSAGLRPVFALAAVNFLVVVVLSLLARRSMPTTPRVRTS